MQNFGFFENYGMSSCPHGQRRGPV